MIIRAVRQRLKKSRWTGDQRTYRKARLETLVKTEKLWRRSLGKKEGYSTITKAEGFISRREMRFDWEMSVPGTCCSPFTQRPLLSNLYGGWSAVVFKCTYQSRNSSICRFFEALGLKGIEGMWMATNSARSLQSSWGLDHGLPSLLGSYQMTIFLKPRHSCLPSLTLSVLIVTVVPGT